MENGRILRNSQIIILGICIAVATIVASVILSQGFLKVIRFTKEMVTVTGSAQREINSDYIVWKCRFSRRDTDLPKAYKTLKSDLDKVKSYLLTKKISEQDMTVSQINVITIFTKNQDGRDTNVIGGYELSQFIELRSKEVEKVAAVSREATELINDGLLLNSEAPQYFYTKLDALKIEMLAKATENAKQRALSMANSTGNKIGFMRSAKMGVFQITPVTSTDISDWGVNDTHSFAKKIMAVVTVSFAIE